MRVASGSQSVYAPPEHVFAILCDLHSWPTWHPGVESSDSPTPLKEGSKAQIQWRKGTTREYIVTKYEPPYQLDLETPFEGGKFVLRFDVRPKGIGCMVEHSVELYGDVAVLHARRLNATFGPGVVTALKQLAIHAEKTAPKLRRPTSQTNPTRSPDGTHTQMGQQKN